MILYKLVITKWEIKLYNIKIVLGNKLNGRCMWQKRQVKYESRSIVIDDAMSNTRHKSD